MEEAKYYLEETEYDGWKEEIKRISSEIEKLEMVGFHTVDDFLKLQALFRDVINLLPKITFHLREKNRIHRFQGATREIDSEEGKFLAQNIRAMMLSDEI